MSPSACPVITGSWALESRSKQRPPSGSAMRSGIGSSSSPSSKSSRRLAASAMANRRRPSASLVVGTGAGERAGEAEGVGLVDQRVAVRDLRVAAAPRPLQVVGQRDELPVGPAEAEPGPAVQALGVLEEDELVAARAGKGPHERGSLPRRGRGDRAAPCRATVSTSWPSRSPRRDPRCARRPARARRRPARRSRRARRRARVSPLRLRRGPSWTSMPTPWPRPWPKCSAWPAASMMSRATASTSLPLGPGRDGGERGELRLEHDS